LPSNINPIEQNLLAISFGIGANICREFEEFDLMASASVASSTLPCSSLVRRTANPHPNLWDYDFVQSLKSPYTVSNFFISLHIPYFFSSHEILVLTMVSTVCVN